MGYLCSSSNSFSVSGVPVDLVPLSLGDPAALQDREPFLMLIKCKAHQYPGCRLSIMINFTEKNALSIIDPSNPLKFSVIMSGIRYKISLVEEICYCSVSVSFPLNESLVPASVCAFSSFTCDYLILDDFGQVNSL